MEGFKEIYSLTLVEFNSKLIFKYKIKKIKVILKHVNCKLFLIKKIIFIFINKSKDLFKSPYHYEKNIYFILSLCIHVQNNYF